MSAFTHRHRKNLLAVGIAALATASLAACGGADESPTSAPSNASATVPTPSTAASTTLAAAPSSNATAFGEPKTEKKTSQTVTCTGANTKVVVSKVSNPLNHLLITATNTGKVPCNAYKAPGLRIDEAQAATQINQDSQPQAVMTIKPGESVYAGLTTSSAAGEGTDGFTARKLEVHFDSRDGSGSVDPHATWIFKSGVYVDSAAQVTFWQSSVAEALTW
ncbi:DUF4232 domain-containing protein [Kribbella sp. DT2]|uniref:DUF4232 domain-containing protein n=1 Tax=Kribbella sp. DT2 TaxID=3393427 RepID=UPI003CEB7C32